MTVLPLSEMVDNFSERIIRVGHLNGLKITMSPFSPPDIKKP